MLAWFEHSLGQKSIYWLHLGTIFNIFAGLFYDFELKFHQIIPMEVQISS